MLVRGTAPAYSGTASVDHAIDRRRWAQRETLVRSFRRRLLDRPQRPPKPIPASVSAKSAREISRGALAPRSRTGLRRPKSARASSTPQRCGGRARGDQTLAGSSRDNSLRRATLRIQKDDLGPESRCHLGCLGPHHARADDEHHSRTECRAHHRAARHAHRSAREGAARLLARWRRPATSLMGVSSGS